MIMIIEVWCVIIGTLNVDCPNPNRPAKIAEISTRTYSYTSTKSFFLGIDFIYLFWFGLRVSRKTKIRKSYLSKKKHFSMASSLANACRGKPRRISNNVGPPELVNCL